MGVWPQSVLTRFAAIPVHPTENDIYPPYCKLLNILFAPDGPFTVAPLSYNDSFLVEFQVFWKGCQSFFCRITQGLIFACHLHGIWLIFKFANAWGI